VEALKSLGPDRITPRHIARVRQWLAPDLREKILADTDTVTGWVYAAIREVCTEVERG
jgi:hypothetical protein